MIPRRRIISIEIAMNHATTATNAISVKPLPAAKKPVFANSAASVASCSPAMMLPSQ